jgi:class 3 adenylate cyclase
MTRPKVQSNRRSLFQKYFFVLFIVVVVPLLANNLSEAWFAYRDQRTMVNSLLRVEAVSAASKIQGFLDEIRNQIGWMVQRPWSGDTAEQHRLDALRLLRQVPAVTAITLVDEAGLERLYVSRTALNRTGTELNRSDDPAVVGARISRIWYGPVTFYQESEPQLTMAIAGTRSAVGIAVAEINLKLIWDVILAIHVGKTGQAFVIDRSGHLIAHPDISKVLRGIDEQSLSAIRRLRETIVAASGEAVTTRDIDQQKVLAAMAQVPGPEWSVVVEQPVSEAFASIYAALWRTGGLLLAGTALALGLAYWLARRMTGPIRLLEEGTELVGAGNFNHRINIATGDELERLANRFNEMAGELALSQERSERIAQLKRFLAPQVAELLEKAGSDHVLAGKRADVAVVFCDLRGFTAFAAHAAPDVIMEVLGEYYTALGAVITRFEATLTSFSGDGLMVLVNAPVPCPEPAAHATRMGIEMQKAVQRLIVGWRARNHLIGFGVGIAMGPATVGRIGYESRVDYTAIGNVVNLASRLCSSAEDEQILIDAIVAESVRGNLPLAPLGARPMKGYEAPIDVYSVNWST